MNIVPFKNFNANENNTWKTLFNRQSLKRNIQLVPQFEAGLKALNINGDKIPDIEDVNKKLRQLTGWEGIPVEGLEEGESFYSMLAQKKFPIGNFIRDEKDLSYTPAPDIFHDLYGHIPFYCDSQYAQFCQEYGRQASQWAHDAKVLREFERFFWFTVEFGLIETREGRRIFGAGIASSFDECAYALSDKPQVVPFDIELIREQEFNIDIIQQKLFVLKSADQLYSSLAEFTKKYKK